MNAIIVKIREKMGAEILTAVLEAPKKFDDLTVTQNSGRWYSILWG